MVERHLPRDLEKAVSEGAAEFTTSPNFPGSERLASFAQIAERSGYRYMGHAPGTASLNNPVHLFQRAQPAQADIALLRSRMIVDACDRYTPRVLSNVLLFPVAAAIFLIFPGYTVERVLVAGGVWGVLIFYLVGLAITRRRRTKHLARPAAAGVAWPATAGA
ncbi:hypothetical protein OHT76_25145 [Streptomyces sp. NBC_00287]|uniref:hypothetical protein n=1 Tax=Streptomyces sp. NBC_00287 TaxID=2975702 RepID=UPI002E2D046B|nr:hypothetical protein [Streptomyces sp. NBC_00287]